jgi:hypothetical protein
MWMGSESMRKTKSGRSASYIILKIKLFLEKKKPSEMLDYNKNAKTSGAGQSSFTTAEQLLV